MARWNAPLLKWPICPVVIRPPSGLRYTDSPVRRRIRAGAREDAAALVRAILRHGEERAHHPGDDAERHELAQEAAEEEPAVRQAERDEDEEVERRRVIRDVDRLRPRKRLALPDVDADAVEPEDARRDGRAIAA